MIDRIHRTVDFLLNKDSRGAVKPADKDLAIHAAVLELYDEMIFDVNRLINRENRGLISGGLDNVVDKVRDMITYYLTDADLVYADGHFALPTDIKYIDSVFYNNEIIELAHGRRAFQIMASADPTEEYPIGFKGGNRFEILPNTIQDNVTISYLRTPRVAKWTYNVVNRTELFNPSAQDFQDIDIHLGQEDDLLLKVCLHLGINLKSPDVQKYALEEKARIFNNEIQS